MSTAIAIFVKTPNYSNFKTRLKKDLEHNKTTEFYNLCIKCCEENSLNLRKLTKNKIKSYWAVAEKQALNSPYWQNLNCIHSGYGDLGHRLHNVYSKLITKHDKVVLMGSDSPQISCEIILKANNLINKNQIIFGKSYDGGFYLFGSSLKIPKAYWTKVKYSKSSTLKNLSKSMRNIADVLYIEPLIDVDEINDIKILNQELSIKNSVAKQNLKLWISENRLF